jgi:hypothetical protein
LKDDYTKMLEKRVLGEMCTHMMRERERDETEDKRKKELLHDGWLGEAGAGPSMDGAWESGGGWHC